MEEKPCGGSGIFSAEKWNFFCKGGLLCKTAPFFSATQCDRSNRLAFTVVSAAGLGMVLPMLVLLSGNKHAFIRMVS